MAIDWGARSARAPQQLFTTESGLLFVFLCVDPDASSLALGIQWQPGEGHKDVIAALSRCYRVRIGRGGHIFDPRVGLRIDDPKHRSSREISRAEVIIAIASIEPDLVTGAHLVNHRHNSPIARAHDDRVALVAAETASHQNLLPRPHVKSVRTASSALLHRNWKGIDNLVSQRIDHRN